MRFCWECPVCGERVVTNYRETPLCDGCFVRMRRDYRAEGANLHMSRGLDSRV